MPRLVLSKIPLQQCLPFPSSYRGSRYHDCFARRVWNNLVMVKLEMTKMMGRYSQQQGLFGRESARLYFTAETWGFLCLQCSGILSVDDFRLSKRFRVHRMIESGLVVKAARIQKTCTILRFATKRELKGLCSILGESIIAGQRCRLPKSAHPKSLWINDIINAVCGCNVRDQALFCGANMMALIWSSMDCVNCTQQCATRGTRIPIVQAKKNVIHCCIR